MQPTATRPADTTAPAFWPRVWTEVPLVLALAIPIVVGLTASTLIGVVDTVMIAPLGTIPMAAASLATSVMIIMCTGIYGLLSVVHVRLAQGVGAGNADAVSTTLRNGLALALCVGVCGSMVMICCFPLLALFEQPGDVLTALHPYWIATAASLVPYALLSTLRGLFNAVHRPWLATAVAMLSVCLNIPLNYLLIHGAFGAPGLGLLGAGLGSLIAQAFACLFAYRLWCTVDAFRPYRTRSALSVSNIYRAFVDGLPVAVGNLAEGSAYAIAGLLLGLFGAASLAANQVVHSVAALMYMLPVGMSSAAAICIGQAAGAFEYERLRAIGASATLLTLAWMMAFFVLLLTFRKTIAQTLSADPEVVSLSVTLFLTVGFTQFADGLQSTSLGALRGLMDVRVPTLITLIAYWLVGLPAAYTVGVVIGFGPNGIWAGFGLGVLIAALALQIRFLGRTRGMQEAGSPYTKRDVRFEFKGVNDARIQG